MHSYCHTNCCISVCACTVQDIRKHFSILFFVTGGADYEAVDQSLSFSGTNKVQQVNIVIIDDNDTDVDDKIFCLQLSYNAKTYTSCVTIMEDDCESLSVSLDS